VREVCERTGITPPASELITWAEACEIEPASLAASLNPDQRAIIETIFMEKDSVELTALGGGFSGSLLLLGKAKKNGASLEPVVIKIDKHLQIKREDDGYAKVKDLLGGRVPGFDPPVSMGDYTGVKIALAALRGTPRTFQSLFEAAETGDEIDEAEQIFSESLETLGDRLYKNTKRSKSVSPIQKLGLNRSQHEKWLGENIGFITPGQQENDEIEFGSGMTVKNPRKGFSALQQQTQEVTTDVCIAHRDLTFWMSEKMFGSLIGRIAMKMLWKVISPRWKTISNLS
jgi:hypothetical protein